MTQRRFSLNKNSHSETTSFLWGFSLIRIGLISLIGFLFAAIISKLLPRSNNSIVSAIQNDRYYCFLVPLTGPILFVAVYFRWLSMKLFQHA